MVGAFAFAAVFYGAAEYEHMTGWKWAIASLATSFVVSLLFPGFIPGLLGQVGLFGVLWWQNSKRLDALHVDRAAKIEEDRQVRQERVRQAREEADQRRDRK
ncbi:MAG: hypothetical protein AUH12_00625 [Gemmatimonadetes bacterium 13_2_20CM_69_8]|nr:MAG: hypothetical protein AUH12_00625 [Gemmatimonadetes bacterium 13_2_20CM_69_8]OLC96034.1 MAG: hypothetical protein AUJ00_05115 [Gemmatimonadetes bacterium 13_1_40CM_3_70_6]OLD96017.1 MAG: hypothetical protein AUG79_03880 [Gemmatimonadetes bacterium 13_1_20CM_4_69_16]PYO14243.1 MAG: hypothetical protein DMD31_10625 [Gemmatimonadota bacterium]